jgi:hypothetical protein
MQLPTTTQFISLLQICHPLTLRWGILTMAARCSGKHVASMTISIVVQDLEVGWVHDRGRQQDDA